MKYQLLRVDKSHNAVDGIDSRKRGLRTIAVVEGLKGLLVLVAGLGLLSLIHHDFQEMAEAIVQRLHLNPAHNYPRIFVDAATGLTDTRLWLFAGAALVYAALHTVEAIGLWRERLWALWFGVINAGVYIPLECFELLHSVTWPTLVVLSINVVVVGYLGYALWRVAPTVPNSA